MSTPMPTQTPFASEPDRFVTTSFRTVGWAGAILFTLAPPAFLYEFYLAFYTTAIETNPTIGLFTAASLILSFASIPMMLVGRRRRESLSPSTRHIPARSA